MDYAAPRALCCSARRVEVAARPSSVGEVCLFPALLMVEECCYDSLFSFSSSVRLLGSAESSEGGSPWGPNEGCSWPSGCFVIPNSKCKLAFQATCQQKMELQNRLLWPLRVLWNLLISILLGNLCRSPKCCVSL